MKIKFKLLKEGIKKPTLNKFSGLDIYLAEDLEILPFNTVLINTGLSCKVPKHHSLLFCNNSSNFFQNVNISTSYFDNKYTGEICLPLINNNHYVVKLSRGTRISQALCITSKIDIV